MMEFTLTWRELLVAVVLATLVYLIEYMLFSRRRAKKAPEQDASQMADLRVLQEEVSSLRQRLDAMEARIGGSGALEEVEVAPSVYDYALQYAKEGLQAQEIAGRCGISVSEATLIVAMHREDS